MTRKTILNSRPRTPEEREQHAARRTAWADALESGDYLQTFCVLRDDFGPSIFDESGPPCFCVFGVLMELAIKDGLPVRWSQTWQAYILTHGPAYQSERFETYVPDVVRDWVGLNTNDGAYFRDVHTKNPTRRNLANDHDGDGFSFHEIAAIIREEPPGLFTTL